MAIGMAETAIIMNATPATTGVISRRSWASQAPTANWISDEATTRLDMRASPPSCTANTHTARKGTPGPISSTYPDPSRPYLVAWSATTAPATMRLAKSAHSR